MHCDVIARGDSVKKGFEDFSPRSSYKHNTPPLALQYHISHFQNTVIWSLILNCNFPQFWCIILYHFRFTILELITTMLMVIDTACMRDPKVGDQDREGGWWRGDGGTLLQPEAWLAESKKLVCPMEKAAGHWFPSGVSCHQKLLALHTEEPATPGWLLGSGNGDATYNGKSTLIIIGGG